jgi:histidinol dehydrogenase
VRLERGPADAARVRGLVPEPASVTATVAQVVAGVRAGGDAAVLEYSRRFDGVEPRGLRADGDAPPLDPEAHAALAFAEEQIAAVAAAWPWERREVVLGGGQRVALREEPVRRAGIYVPGGRAPYVSSVLMGVVTARTAGVDDVHVCAPPGPDGEVHAGIRAACAYLGGVTLWRMGGAQAIAALAYGTETVPRVDVIAGPGNLYVQEAKRQVSGDVGIDGFAGPSDVLCLVTEGAEPRHVALDLLAQGEHGAASLAVAAARDAALLDAIEAELRALAPERPTTADAVCALVHADDLLAFAEAFAPEHLQLMGAEAEALAGDVRAAGCVFVGTGTAFGDYVAGSNHVLPTGGGARFASGLNPAHFRRRMAEVRVPPEAARVLAPAGAALARLEGFAVHAESMEARINRT